jgi:replicative DNA helicase
MREYLEDKGINVSKPFQCLNPEHNDRNPSMSFDTKRNKVHCFSCDADYDVFDLIGIDYNLNDGKEIFHKAYELYRLDVDGPLVDGRSQSPKAKAKGKGNDAPHPFKQENKAPKSVTSFLKACQAELRKTAYIGDRGISFETAQRFGLGFSMNMNKEFKVPWPAIIIPTGETSFTARNVNPNAEKADRIRKYGTSEVLNFEATKGDAPVFITEGEFDMLSVEEAGYNAISLGSTANVNKFLSMCKENPPKCPGFILFLDNDDSGKECTKKLTYELSKLGVFSVGPSDEISLGEHKDANDFLVSDWDEFRWAVGNYVSFATTEFKRRQEEARLKVFGDNVSTHIDAFQDGIKASISIDAVSTGFDQLDFQLDGGFYEGFYVMGAITSLGKTTFALQIADHVARSGTDVVIFSLEMSRFELMAKSISRLTLERCERNIRNAKTVRGILAGKRYENYSEAEKKLIKLAVEEYRQYGENIFISEGQGEIGALQVRERIDKHLSFTGRRPFMIIDYLQLLSPYDPRSTDKQNTDKAVLELKRVSRDFKIPVLAISSFNRENYKNPVSLEAFKESGAIEYSSDVLIGLQAKGAGDKDFNVDEARKKNPREVVLKILKNRNGAAGGMVEYRYYSMFNMFEEVGFYTR